MRKKNKKHIDNKHKEKKHIHIGKQITNYKTHTQTHKPAGGSLAARAQGTPAPRSCPSTHPAVTSTSLTPPLSLLSITWEGRVIIVVIIIINFIIIAFFIDYQIIIIIINLFLQSQDSETVTISFV